MAVVLKNEKNEYEVFEKDGGSSLLNQQEEAICFHYVYSGSLAYAIRKVLKDAAPDDIKKYTWLLNNKTFIAKSEEIRSLLRENCKYELFNAFHNINEVEELAKSSGRVDIAFKCVELKTKIAGFYDNSNNGEGGKVDRAISFNKLKVIREELIEDRKNDLFSQDVKDGEVII
jgi:hypothetical protein